MPSVLLIFFVLQLALHIINTVGANTINQLLWVLYNKFPTPTSKAAQEQPRLQREVVRLKRELNAVSAQDEFSKWAKLRRQHDKAMADCQKIDESLRSTKTKFDTTVSTLRWLSTNGLRFVLQFWFSKQPMFWLPQGWAPGYVEWVLSFPRAPKGSISINIWGIACASVIALFGEAITAIYVLATRVPVKQEKEKKEPQTFKAETEANDKRQKKEL